MKQKQKNKNVEHNREYIFFLSDQYMNGIKLQCKVAFNRLEKMSYSEQSPLCLSLHLSRQRRGSAGEGEGRTAENEFSRIKTDWWKRRQPAEK